MGPGLSMALRGPPGRGPGLSIELVGPPGHGPGLSIELGGRQDAANDEFQVAGLGEMGRHRMVDGMARVVQDE
jgi:hypothetical protein